MRARESSAQKEYGAQLDINHLEVCGGRASCKQQVQVANSRSYLDTKSNIISEKPLARRARALLKTLK